MTAAYSTPAPVRTLKIEEDGDPWRRTVRPKIRLKGQWLERAGFRHGNHVSVKFIASGVIELRTADAGLALNDKAP
jgi:hypothetical protein